MLSLAQVTNITKMKSFSLAHVHFTFVATSRCHSNLSSIGFAGKISAITQILQTVENSFEFKLFAAIQ